MRKLIDENTIEYLMTNLSYMKTSIEEKLEELWLPPSREWEIVHHSINSVRNPMPSKMKPLDYYVNNSGWQRRYILSIELDNVCYAYYLLEDYHFWNSGRIVDWKMKYNPIDSGYWQYRWFGYCTKAHIRNWSQK